VGGVLLAILLAPGAIVVLLGLELLERRLFGSGPAATARLRPAQLRERERHPCRAMPGARRGGQAELFPVNVWDGRLSAHIEV
jgi:hypothetical protein